MKIQTTHNNYQDYNLDNTNKDQINNNLNTKTEKQSVSYNNVERSVPECQKNISSLICLNDISVYKDREYYEKYTTSIKTETFYGTKAEIGLNYGKVFNCEMKYALDSIKKYFIDDHKISYKALVERADILYSKYDPDYHSMFENMAKGSGLSLNDIKILNGMETLHSLVRNSQDSASGCSIFVTKNGGNNIIGRNYDFHYEPYVEIAAHLVVTTICENGKIPVTLVGLPGQIYCATCISAEGIFASFNSGSSIGGSFNKENPSLLANLMQIMQNSKNLEEFDANISKYSSDYSLIVNAADKDSVKSYEFSSNYGMRTNHKTDLDQNFVSTNFFQNSMWLDTPLKNGFPATDEKSWQGLTRYNNLSKASKTNYTDNDVMELISRKIENGGATSNSTIYQAIFNPTTMILTLRRPHYESPMAKYEFLIGNNFKDYYRKLSLNPGYDYGKYDQSTNPQYQKNQV